MTNYGNIFGAGVLEATNGSMGWSPKSACIVGVMGGIGLRSGKVEAVEWISTSGMLQESRSSARPGWSTRHPFLRTSLASCDIV